MWDKTKVYGYTEEEMREFLKTGSIPEDNEVMIESDCDELLTFDEIKRMFPCQCLGLRNVEWVGERPTFEFTKASVAFYHCEPNEVGCMKIDGIVEEFYSTVPEWMGDDL